jgi:hypothetical protein
MSDQFGFLEGAKSVTGSMDASREASKSITKSIVDVQKDAAAVAQQKDLDRKRQIRESQVLKEQYFKRAMMEWQRQESIRIEEAKVKTDFIKKHGTKRWSEIETIKQKIERQDNELSREFKEDLAKVRRAMLMCYIVAAFIAYYLTWGYKG